MNSIYSSVGFSKQNFHQQLRRHDLKQEEAAYIWELMMQLREDHPMMGARTMYDKLNPGLMGRDAFIELYNESGLRVRKYKNYRRTTNSSGVKRFPNLIQGLELTGVNQAYCSDITYYEIEGKFYYLTFIMDLYSRRVVGWNASKSLRTEDTTIPCLKTLLKRVGSVLPIFHSDGGGQYYSRAFLSLTKGYLRNSMGKTAYENPNAERLNGTIKNDYLRGYSPTNYPSLKKMLNKAVKMYNTERPHRGLDKRTPIEFERLIEENIGVPQSTKHKKEELIITLTDQ